VSNYTEKHLDELISSCEIKPMVNQVEVHPWLAQPQLRSVCNLHGVVVQAYSPLGVGSVCPFFSLETLDTKPWPFVEACFEMPLSLLDLC
jgi:diketogulonate reductase-like aldo/keto reductase